MNMSRVAKAIFAGSPRRLCFLILSMLALPFPAKAALTDTVAENEIDAPTLSTLSPESGRKVEAMAKYMAGLLDEETAGPEKAFESYRRVLDLEPGFSELAIYVAHEHLRRGDYPEALSVLKDALKANPRDGMLCLALSSVYLRQLEKPDLALKYAQRAQELNPEDIVPYEALCEIYVSQEGSKNRTKQVLERAAKSHSTDPQFWLKLGELSCRSPVRDNPAAMKENIAKAAPLFEKALKYADGDLMVMARAVEYYILARQTNLAIPICERILKSDPDFPHMLENLAACYKGSGKTDEAIATYEKVIEKDLFNVGAYDDIADLYQQKGDNARALDSLRQALIVDPYDKGRYAKAGELAVNLQKSEEAIHIFSNARIRFPSVPEFTYGWALGLSIGKKYQEAMRAYEQAIFEASSLRPGMLDARFYNRYGATAAEAGLYARAEEMMRKSIELDPQYSDAYNGLGYMWAERGENLDEAESMIRKALALEPGNGAYIDSLGWVLYQKNKHPEALAELLRAAERLEKPDATVYEHIGDTYQKLNQPTEAVLYWQKAAALSPESKTLIGKIDGNTKKVADGPAAPPILQTPAPPAAE